MHLLLSPRLPPCCSMFAICSLQAQLPSIDCCWSSTVRHPQIQLRPWQLLSSRAKTAFCCTASRYVSCLSCAHKQPMHCCCMHSEVWTHLTGGSANLAFREDEELKPICKKKSQAALLSASLDDDCFTIPAWKAGAPSQDTPSHGMTEQGEPGSGAISNHADSDADTESMLTASSGVLDIDSINISTPSRSTPDPSNPSTAHTVSTSLAVDR